jgi:transcription elongation factor GreA
MLFSSKTVLLLVLSEKIFILNPMQDATLVKTVQVTQEGLEELQRELKELVEIKLPANVERVSKAREYGDLSENAEYHSAKEDQTLIETRIDEIEKILAMAQVVQQTKSSTKVGMGSSVTIAPTGKGKAKSQIFTIVGEFEAVPAEGKVSSVSPIGKALMGKKKGDHVTVIAPVSQVEYEILDIK